ncbi:hypothetical protein [Pseudomonas cedrina]|uniref:hypothetical protein n=1 Tax=Pseudomonas cedrina TaxID=651740 RepID=UPI002785348E|nr:hypothetical protein [Pseudomonas cedrina]MDQ0653490.1 hypothetical protein [Pseudomonas cedrina]
MKGRIASIVFAGAWLIASSSAWSWTRDGDKVKFSKAEWSICRLFEHDAAVVILNRQEGYTLDFEDRFPPSVIQMRMRNDMIFEAGAIPIESSPEKRMAVGEKFTKRFLGKCFRLLYETYPPGKY